MNARRLLLPAAVFLAALAVFVPAARPKGKGADKDRKPAATPPAPAGPPPVPAHLRLWKTDLPDTPNVRLTWKSGADLQRGKPGPDAPEVARAGAGYQFGDYVEVPPGPGALAADADGRALASLPANLAVGSFHTVLLTAAGAELLDDDPAPAPGTSDFGLRVLIPGLRALTVSVGENLKARFDVPGDGLLRMRGLRASVQTVRTEGTDAEGKSFSWTSEADFRASPRQTLLVYPDPYGRIRPRFSVDGRSGAPEEKATKP